MQCCVVSSTLVAHHPPPVFTVIATPPLCENPTYLRESRSLRMTENEGLAIQHVTRQRHHGG